MIFTCRRSPLGSFYDTESSDTMHVKTKIAGADWIKTIVLLCNGWLILWVYRTMLTPIFPELQMTIGAQSDVKMGLISSCYFFAYTFTQIPAGILMDKVGRKVVLVPGFFLFLIGTLLVASSRDISSLYVGGILAGIGTGAYYSGSFSTVAEQIPKNKQFISTAIVNNGCAVGMIIGVLSASVFVKSGHISWQTLVYIVAGLVGVMMMAMLFLLRNDRPNVQKKSTLQTVPIKSVLRQLFKAPLVSSYFLFFSTSYGYYVIVTWLPSFLEQEKGITGSATGMLASVMAITSIPGSLLFSRLADRFQKKKIFLLIMMQVVSALMLLFAAQTTSVFLLIVCMSIYGMMGKQAIDPLILPHVTQLNNPKSLSTGLGVFNFFGMCSSIFAPVVTGVIADGFGSKIGGFYLAAALLLVSAVLFWKINQKG